MRMASTLTIITADLRSALKWSTSNALNVPVGKKDEVEVEQGLKSHQTHYRSYRGQVLWVKWPNQQKRFLRWCMKQQLLLLPFTALWILSGTTRMSRHQNKHSPIYTYPDYLFPPYTVIHCILSIQFRAWQSFCMTSVHVFFGLPVGLAPSTSYSIHFFTQSLSSFCTTCLYRHNLFRCSTEIMSMIGWILAWGISNLGRSWSIGVIPQGWQNCGLERNAR